MTTAQDRLNQILPTWYSLLTQWSLDGSLVAAATDALVLDGSNAKQGSEGLLQSYVSQWSAGNIKNLPQIVLLSEEDISGAQGAYANSTDTIYLNQEWLLTATEEEIQKVLTEELGHYLDDQLNQVDTKGDEGEHFSYQLFNGPLSLERKIIFSQENDSITLNISNTSIIAEAAGGAASAVLIGGTAQNYANKVIALPDGSSVVIGTFSGTMTFGDKSITSSNRSIFIAKLLPNGTYQWVTTVSNPYISCDDITLLEDGSMMLTGVFYGSASFGAQTLVSTGSTYADAYVAKIDSSGSFLWANKYGSIFGEGSYSISASQNGSAIVVGHFGGTASYGGITSTTDGAGSASIAKVLANGDYAWVRTVGSAVTPDYSQGVATLADGSSITTGWFTGTGTFGKTNLSSSGRDDIFATKLDKDGNFLWSVRAGGSENDAASAISASTDGTSVITGLFRGSANFGSTSLNSRGDSDAFILKLDANGSILWTQQIGGALADAGVDISILPDGSSVVAGVFQGQIQLGTGLSMTARGSNDIYVVKYDALGSVVWFTQAGGEGGVMSSPYSISGQSNMGLTVYPDGSFGLVGSFAGSVSFGNTKLTSLGGYDAFIAKLNANGSWGEVVVTDTGNASFRINGNGTGTDAQNLTCILDTLDPDGMTKFPPSLPSGYSYQWEISTDGSTNWTNATGSGNSTFKYSVSTTTDANKFLRVKVGYQDDKGFNEIVYTGNAKILSGTSKNDSFNGTSGIDVTFSGLGADAIATGAGNDFAKGGVGNDTFNGANGDGDDFFDGQTEIDTINYSASTIGVVVDMVTGVATERAAGGIGKDSFVNIENARGSSVDDIFTGNLGVNSFTGVSGKDTFRFINKQLGANACDRITDFSGDTIELTRSAFGLASTMFPSSTNFFASVSGTKAVNASAASLVYDTGTGYLYLNTDGAVSGLGTGGGVIAILANKAALTSANFNLV